MKVWEKKTHLKYSLTLLWLCVVLLSALYSSLFLSQKVHAGELTECYETYDRLVDRGTDISDRSEYVLVYARLNSTDPPQATVVCGDDVDDDSVVGVAEWGITAGSLFGNPAHSSLYIFDSWAPGTNYFSFYEYMNEEIAGYVYLNDDLTASILPRNQDSQINTFVEDPLNIKTTYLNSQKNNENPDRGLDADEGVEDPEAPQQEEEAGNDTCNLGAGPLAWIVCPVITASLDGIQFLYREFILPQLSTDPLIIENVEDSSQANIYQTWSNIRSVANVLFVIVFLYIIFSQALGLNVDAYSIKKTLPRLIIAAILVQLSYFVAAFINDIANILGQGIRSLVVSPAGDATLFRLEDGGDAAALSFVFAGVLGAATAGLFAVSPIILAGLFALVIGVLVLIVRRVILLTLVIFSPIAMVMWVLPNTEKYAKQWFDLYIKVLIMFPLIAALIGVGELLSATITGSGADVGMYEYLAALTVLFAPYFLLPFTFRFAGGVLSTVTGMVNDKSRGFIDRKRQVAQEKASINRKALSSGSRFSGRNPMTRGLNKATGYRPTAAGKAKVEAGRLQAAAMQSETQPLQDIKTNDRAQSILAFNTSSLSARKFLEEKHADIDKDVAAGKISTEEGKTKKAAWNQAYGAAKRAGFTQSSRMAALNQLTASGYQFEPGEKGYQQLSEAVATITDGEGSASYANTMNSMQYNLKNAGRFDLGAAGNDGLSYDFSKGWSKASLYQLANGKEDTFKGGVDYYKDILQRGDATDEQKVQAGVFFNELRQIQSSATGGNAKTINEILRGDQYSEFREVLQNNLDQSHMQEASQRSREYRPPSENERQSTNPPEEG